MGGGAITWNYSASTPLNAYVKTGSNTTITATDDTIVMLCASGSMGDRWVRFFVNDTKIYDSGATNGSFSTIVKKGDTFKWTYNHQDACAMLWANVIDYEA